MLCNFLRCHPSLPFYTLPSTTMSGPSPFATGPRPEEDPLPQCPPRPPAQLWGAGGAAAPPPTPLLVPPVPTRRARRGLCLGRVEPAWRTWSPILSPPSHVARQKLRPRHSEPPFPAPRQGESPPSHAMRVANRLDAARPVGCAHRPRARPGSESAFASAVHTSLPSPRCPPRQDVGTGRREGGVFISPPSPFCWDLSEHAE